MDQMLIVFLLAGLAGIGFVFFGLVKLLVELKKQSKAPRPETIYTQPKASAQEQIHSILREFEEKWRDQNK
ncbi:MAG: hypothetical protein JW750_00070 [Anaerolineaceae bacterium]|nr:hypothetical protein [Anaerolineaceae bacterium]